MTTFVDFAPTVTAPFQFQAVLDGETYNLIATWSLFGRRYVVNCFALDGSLVFAVPLIGSPVGLTIQSLAWANGAATATVVDPHGYAPGSTVRLTISGCAPEAWNGTFDALVLDPLNFSYALAADPGAATAFGRASRNINIAGGYFASTLVYREANGQFEVSP